ncbi:hypothetical protein LCGC14_1330000 [marine sediment metagenome]|uniref:Uncharacterized protein n=1 Tax=marine sediment metagenome TaxID=412755 RepID=A0A0F9NJD4_9ZZZZ
MNRLFRAVVAFLYRRLGYRKVFVRGVGIGVDVGIRDGFQDAVDTVQDWYVCEEEDYRP